MASPRSKTINVSEDLYNILNEIAYNTGSTMIQVNDTVITHGLRVSPNGKNKTHSAVTRWTSYFKQLIKGE